MKKRSKKAPGSGHIRERTLKSGEKRWDVLVHKDGKQVLLEACKSPGLAGAILLEWAAQREAEGHRVPRDIGVMTLGGLGELYLKALPDERRAERRSIFRARIEPAEFAKWPLTQISEDSVAQWIDTMARTPVVDGKSKGQLPSRSTLQNALNLLRDILRWGRIHGHLTTNPAKAVSIRESTITIPRSTARGQGFDYLREPEVRRILEAGDKIPADKRCAFTLLAFTGARPKDLYLLTWDRVDVAGARIQFRTHKKRRDYTAHLLPPALEAIRELWVRAGQPTAGLVFHGPKGAPHTKGYDWGWTTTSTKGKRYDGYRKRAGIRREVPLYSLRHTCASHLLLGTELFTGGRRWSLEEISSHLGHADMSTVETYAVALNIASMRAVDESREAIKQTRAAKQSRIAAIRVTAQD